MFYTPMFVVLLTVSVLCPFTSSKALPKSKDNHFDYLLFAHFWPPSSCVYMEQKGDKCYIPPDIHDWTIHGLWPSRKGSELPQNCNASMPFDYSKIVSLRPQLDKEWRFYDNDSSATYLWEHEWNKHGTCAYSLPALKGELAYFSMTLKLHQTLNITKALAAEGIVPSSEKTYHMEDFNRALKNHFGHDPVIVCDYDRKTKETYLDQIHLCYDKSFKLIDCYPPSSASVWQSPKTGLPTFYSNCEEKDKIIYCPFNNREYCHRQRSKSLVFQSENSKH